MLLLAGGREHHTFLRPSLFCFSFHTSLNNFLKSEVPFSRTFVSLPRTFLHGYLPYFSNLELARYLLQDFRCCCLFDSEHGKRYFVLVHNFIVEIRNNGFNSHVNINYFSLHPNICYACTFNCMSLSLASDVKAEYSHTHT